MTATTTPDHYATLGVPRDATADDIHAAYRLRARMLHPDAHVGSPAAVRDEAARMFSAVNGAYTVLGTQARRAEYDREDVRADEGDDDFDVQEFVDLFSSRVVAASRRAGLPHELAVAACEGGVDAIRRSFDLIPPRAATRHLPDAVALQMAKAGFGRALAVAHRRRHQALGNAFWEVATAYADRLPAALANDLDALLPRPDLPAAERAAGKTVRRRSTGRRVVTGVLVAVAIAKGVALLTGGASVASGADAEVVNALEVGECLVTPGQPTATRPCTGAVGEDYVFVNAASTSTTWPGAASLDAEATRRCEPGLVPGGLSVDVQADGSIPYNAWYPSRETWEAGDRTIVCTR